MNRQNSPFRPKQLNADILSKRLARRQVILKAQENLEKNKTNFLHVTFLNWHAGGCKQNSAIGFYVKVVIPDTYYYSIYKNLFL